MSCLKEPGGFRNQIPQNKLVKVSPPGVNSKYAAFTQSHLKFVFPRLCAISDLDSALHSDYI